MTFGVGLALLLAVLIGLSLGLLGGGGAIVTLPVLVYVAGIPPQDAVGMSIAVVGGTSLVGGFVQYFRGHLDVQTTLLFGLTGMIAAYWGARLTHLLSASVLMLLFACLMLLVGALMFRGRREAHTRRQCRPLHCLAIGAALGVLTGFLGVGGGFLIVPALFLFAGLEMTKAAGTSLAIIAMNSASGLLGQLRFARLDWRLTSGFLVCALVGMLFGLTLAGRIPEQTLRKMFAWLVIAMGGFILIANLTGLTKS